MNFGFMKSVDYWVGRPVCWILTVGHKLWRVMEPSPPPAAAPAKILVMKPSELGAIILALPLLQQLKERYPQAELSFLTFDSNRALFEVTGIIPAKRVLTLTDASVGSFFKDVFKVIARMRRERFDVVIDLEFFSRFTAILSAMSAAPKRVGFHRFSIEGVYRGDLFTHKIPYNPHRHVRQMYMHMISSLDKSDKISPESNADETDFSVGWKFRASAEQQSRLRERLTDFGIKPSTKLYLLAPGEGRIPLREWPLERFISLALKILTDPDAWILVIGLTDPANQGATLVNALPCRDRCFNLIGKTDLSELLTLFTMSEALVVNDSGLGHLAALTSIKHHILFGPEHPSIFSPCGKNTVIYYKGLPCSPCLSVFNHRNSACRDNLCLKAISVDEVFAAVVQK